MPVSTCDFQSKFSSYFVNFFDIMSKLQGYKFKVLDELFVDEDSDFDSDLADSFIKFKRASE